MYDSSLKYKWDNQNVRDYARKEGRLEGMKEGIKEGEYKKATKIAREMKKAGLPVTQITQFTGLSAEEIGKL